MLTEPDEGNIWQGLFMINGIVTYISIEYFYTEWVEKTKNLYKLGEHDTLVT